jgi:aminoglycoside 6'-N-acetyltransferase I
MMKIRQLTEADWDEWRRMRFALWPDMDYDITDEMHQLMARPDESPVFVIERSDGRLGGFIETGTRSYADGCESSPVGYIEGWYVDPDLRRQGVGRALIRRAEEWARERGLTEMASDADLGNEISIQAHKAIGYQEVGRVVEFARRLE